MLDMARKTVASGQVSAFDGFTHAVNSANRFVITEQTLAQGSAIIVSGTTLSLPSGGGGAIVGGSTVAPHPPSGLLYSSLHLRRLYINSTRR